MKSLMNRAIVSSAGLAALIGTLTLAPGCVGNEMDYYADLIEFCDYRTASTEIRTGSDVVKTSLTEECREQLLAILPFDETWETAPAGLQDKVIEAFQVIMAYPLALPPDNQILGPGSIAIHARQLCVLAPQLFEDCPGHVDEENPNLARNAFNYLMDRVQTITYVPPDEATGQSASLTPDLFRMHGPGYLLSITDGFWSGTDDFSMTPFRRASILMHEAWHGDSRTHTLCDSEADVSGFSCDPDIAGPYAFETAYSVALLHGSGKLLRQGDDGKETYLISNLDVMFLGLDICNNLKYRVMTARDLVADVESCWSVTAKWILDKQGIVR